MADDQVRLQLGMAAAGLVNAVSMAHRVFEAARAIVRLPGSASLGLILDQADAITRARRSLSDESARMTVIFHQPPRQVAELRGEILMHEKKIHEHSPITNTPFSCSLFKS